VTDHIVNNRKSVNLYVPEKFHPGVAKRSLERGVIPGPGAFLTVFSGGGWGGGGRSKEFLRGVGQSGTIQMNITRTGTLFLEGWEFAQKNNIKTFPLKGARSPESGPGEVRSIWHEKGDKDTLKNCLRDHRGGF